MYGDTRVVSLSNPCLRRAHPTPPSVPIFPWFLLYLLKKKKKVEMCRVRKTCSIFFSEEKTGTGSRTGGIKLLVPQVWLPTSASSCEGLRGASPTQTAEVIPDGRQERWEDFPRALQS
jgi:hypothetical protein